MRGIAAMAVVLYHVPPLARSTAALPVPLEAVFSNGFLGVNAFFVLSGFVVALSTSRGPWTMGYFGRFALRRSLRLDPPYWVAMLLEVGLGVIGVALLNAKAYPVPSLPSWLAHITYTQTFFGFRQISDVFWTLCFEVQFYFAFVLTLVIATSPKLAGRVAPRTSWMLLFVGIFGWSLLVRGHLLVDPLPGLALIRAFEFLCGTAVYLVTSGMIPKWQATVLVLVAAAARIVDNSPTEALVLVVSCGCCYFAGTRAGFNQALSGRFLQFLGRTSYSIYLYHALLISRVFSVGLLAFPAMNALEARILILVSAAMSVAASCCLYYVVELPSLRLSRRVSLKSDSR